MSVGYHERMGTQTGAMGLAAGGDRRLALVLPLLAAFAGLLLAPAPAQASFHLMKIREVHTGGATDGSYVMLQMFSGGQNFVSGRPIVVYNATGTVAHTFTFSGNVANGASQATILVAGTGYATAFPSPTWPTPDATDAGLNLPATGGAVCFTAAEPPDCVSWGNFTGAASLPSATGTPASAGGVTAGKALHRSIAAGCATLLESVDDTNSSAADFSEQNPNPRSNSSPIVESSCPLPPNTAIGTKPANPSSDTSPSFTYSAIPSSGASFECKLDSGSFESCPAGGITYPGPLAEASHTFQVRAVNSAGPDPSPATYTWAINTAAPPDTTILTKPSNPSEDSTANFTYSSTESGSTFECRLDAGAFASCPAAGVTYSGVANGAHGFQVRAVKDGLTDASPAGYSWQVAAPEPEPPVLPAPSLVPPAHLPPAPVPQTILTLEPSPVTRDRTPTFRFRSSVAGSSFGCKVDGGPFRRCSSPFTTKTLSFGAHAVQIRAAAGGSFDPTPARSGFRVAKPKRRRR
jgi:hypothetical protein